MTYAQHRGQWEAYQPFLPTRLRCEGTREPVQEYWGWRGQRVHLDRHVDATAPVKLIALHGGGGNGRLLASVAAGVAALRAPRPAA